MTREEDQALITASKPPSNVECDDRPRAMAGFGGTPQPKRDKLNKAVGEELLKEAIRTHKAGNLEEAERLYLQVISKGACNEIALSNLGVLYTSTGRTTQALEIYKKAIIANPFFADAHANISNLLRVEGRFEESLLASKKAVDLNPNHAIAYINMAASLAEMGRLDASITAIQKAISLNPLHPAAYASLAAIYTQKNRPSEAITAARKALEIDPSNVEAHISLCKAFLKQARPNDAHDHALRAIALNAYNADAHLALGSTLCNKQDYNEALEAVRKSISLRPRNAAAYAALSAIHRDLGMIEYGLDASLKSIDLNPHHAESYLNLGTIYYELGKYSDAEDCSLKCLELDPENNVARSNLAHYQFLKNDYKQAWLNYACRKQSDLLRANYSDVTDTSLCTPWDGTAGKTVLVIGEQGLGDQILFSSMLTDLQLVCKKVIVRLEPRLLELFKRSFRGNIQFFSTDCSPGKQPIDHFISIADLGFYFRKEQSDFSTKSKHFLHADSDKTNLLRSELCENPNNKIYGISWHSKGKGYFNKKKNIRLESLLEAFESNKQQLISLQYGITTDTIGESYPSCRNKIRVMEDIDVTQDIDGLASLICACDEIITISNTTAHLAGALGKRTHLLLASSPHWYWGAHDSSTVWYPSIRIHRQTQRGSWDSVIASLKNSLQP